MPTTNLSQLLQELSISLWNIILFIALRSFLNVLDNTVTGNSKHWRHSKLRKGCLGRLCITFWSLTTCLLVVNLSDAKIHDTARCCHSVVIPIQSTTARDGINITQDQGDIQHEKSSSLHSMSTKTQKLVSTPNQHSPEVHQTGAQSEMSFLSRQQCLVDVDNKVLREIFTEQLLIFQKRAPGKICMFEKPQVCWRL